MMRSILRGCVLMVTGLAWWTAAPAADDRVVDAMTEPDGPAGNFEAVLVFDDVDMVHSAALPADVVRLFDAAVFAAAEATAVRSPVNMIGGENVGRAVVLEVVGSRGAIHDGALPRLVGVRRQGMKRIDLTVRTCGLSHPQRRMLEMALESDLRRVAGEIDAVRDGYIGTSEEDMDIAAFQADVEGCRQVIARALGPGSLLARMVEDVLEPAQAEVRQRWQHGRRESRWRATVAAALEPLDESLALSSSQYEAVEAFLLEAMPPLRVDAVGGSRAPLPVPLAYHRLASAEAGRLENVLDARQWRVLRACVEPCRRVTIGLMDQDHGIIHAGPPTPAWESERMPMEEEP